jgi:hypothetical protein
MKRFVLAASMLLIVAGVQADVLTLSDGTKIEGQILSKDDTKVLIDTMISGVRVKMSYTRAEISEIETKELPADFFTPAKPVAKNPADMKPKAEAPASPKSKTEIASSPVESSGDGRVPYLEIVVQGTVGEDFDETGIHEVLEFAKQHKIRQVLFSIKSPGGLVFTAEAIQKEMEKYESVCEYSAKIDEALSAAMYMVVMCRHIYYTPEARMGALTHFDAESKEVDAKFNSARAARIASWAKTRSGIPAEVIRAMQVKGDSLYAATDRKTHRVVTSDHAFDPKDYDDCRTLDTDQTILTLTADDAMRLGIGEMWGDRGEPFAAPKWFLFNQLGKAAMERSGQHAKVLVSGIREATDLPVMIKQAARIPHPAQYRDYQYEQGIGSDVAARREQRLTGTSAELWRVREKVYVKAWTGVRDSAADILDSFNRARRTTTLPDGIKELEALAEEASKLANEKLKK